MPAKGKGPLLLAILDGWGLRHTLADNAIALGDTPNLDRYYLTYPWCSLVTCGTDVGLLEGQMGDSNVGHLNIGAGRIVHQWLGLLAKEIADGSFAKNKVILDNLKQASEGTWHLLGLLSDGGVHSHIDHLSALLRMAKAAGQQKVAVHVFLDGRDVGPQTAAVYLKRLESEFKKLGLGRVASICGRFYAMDRDKRWDRVEQAFRAMRYGEGMVAFSPEEALQKAYDREETDEFVRPTVICDPEGGSIHIADGDAVFFYNFRAERAKEISHAFLDDEFKGFDRGPKPHIAYATMAEVETGLPAPSAYIQEELPDTLGQVLAREGLTQLRIAETEKYAHVTFFFDGGLEKDLPGEEKILIPSPKVATYDLQPAMSAPEVTAALLADLAAGGHEVIILNFANGDMVGHTGVWEAALKAVSTVDSCLNSIVEAILAMDGTVLITSDHGNCDQMRYPDGTPHTAHTLSDAPFMLISNDATLRLRNTGRLADIAPTILELLGVQIPEAMTGVSLLQH